MKWDYASVVVWGIDETGVSGSFRFDEKVVSLAKSLGADVETADCLNGYQMAVQVVRKGEKLCHCLTGGTGAAAGSSQFIAASTAAEVYPVLQALFPSHAGSRLDACEDYTSCDAWDKLERLITEICTKHKVSMAPYGEGHRKPDGTRDATKGRTWYCGSKASAFRVVLYDKGLEQLAKGIPDDPNRVRLEVRVRPSSKAKSMVAQCRPLPADLLGMSRWGKELGQRLGVEELQRMAIGSVWRPSEQEELAMKIVRMFDKGIERMIEEYTPEEFGRLIFKAHSVNREVKAAINLAGETQ